MIFTDDDLKRLKDLVKDNGDSFSMSDFALSVTALLARLEAAELILENGVALTHTEDCDKVEHHDLGCSCGAQDRWETWRKAAGK